MPNSADIIARRLYDAGVRHAFGIPGGEVLALISSLDEVGIQFHLTKHENFAGFMAEGTIHASRAPGIPGVLVATLGPGLTNAITVVVNAMQDRVPLIFITGCVDPDQALTYSHQVFDQNTLMKPITKASLTVVDGAVDVVIDKAVSIAMDDPMGPVHINLPISIATRKQRILKPVRRGLVSRGAANGDDLKKAQAWFAKAKKPLIISGIDALNQRAELSVSGFVTRFNIPLITSYKAKGILAENHPLSLGGAGLSPKADQLLLPFIAGSDLVILAGYDPIEMRSGWRNPWSEGTRVIEFCSIPNTHYMHQSSISFVGSVAAGLDNLAGDSKADKTWPDNAIEIFKNKLKSSFESNRNWGPAAIINTARTVLPPECVVTVDTGAHRILLSQIWECYQPRTLLQSTGLCTMGCALPLAAGYKLVQPDRMVVAFTGDAGLEMILGDLATVRDLAGPILIIVFVDESLALIELKQRNTGRKNLAVDFTGTDFVRIGLAYNMHATWVDNTETLQQEIHAAINRNTSTLLACRFSRKAYDGII